MTSCSELTAPVLIGDATGFLFASTLGEGLCFVPADCLHSETAGEIVLDGSRYLLSGWARWNGLFNPFLVVRRLFPDTSAIVQDLAAPEVAEFLHRLRHVKLDLAGT